MISPSDKNFDTRMIRCVFPLPNPCPLLSSIANLLAEDMRLRSLVPMHFTTTSLRSHFVSQYLFRIRKRILDM